jgi:N-acetylmuramoyl-L-alanine amidase
MRHSISLALSILFISWIAFSSEKKFNVVIDPGHGGADSGTVHNKIKESDVVLQISKKILDLLHQKNDVTTVLTRTENKYISLEDRIKKNENKKDIDLFVSLHANSSVSSSIQGMEIYFQPDQTKKSETITQTIIEDLESIGKTKSSWQFAQSLQSAWSLSPSVIRRSSFFVVEKTDSPSVLVELGYLSNPKEAEKLKSATYQSLIAETIVKSIIDYKNSTQ